MSDERKPGVGWGVKLGAMLVGAALVVALAYDATMKTVRKQ